jgi:hypothetical protein
MTLLRKKRRNDMKWISVKDRVPKTFDRVLAYLPNKKKAITWMWFGQEATTNAPWHVSHWMPLPAPPKEGE